MNTHSIHTRLGAYSAFFGALSFLVGAILWGATGADIDAALATNDMAGYLARAGEAQPLLIVNLCFWMFGTCLLGIAGNSLSNLSNPARISTHIAKTCYQIAAPLVLASYVALMAVVVRIVPDTSPASVALASALGWFGTTADWIGTVLFLGAGPFFLALAGRNDWMPTWLVRVAVANGVAGVLTLIGLFTNGMSSYGFLIIPIGMFWVFSVGIVLFRRIGVTSENATMTDARLQEGAAL